MTFDSWTLIHASEQCRVLFKRAKNIDNQDFLNILEYAFLSLDKANSISIQQDHKIHELEKKVAYLLKQDINSK